MLSILGATLEDMEEILKGLGYRADAVKAEDAAAFLSQQDASSTPAPAQATETAAEKADHDDADGTGDEPATEGETAAQAPAEPAAAQPAEASEAAAELAGADAVAAEPAEPKPVLLWRLGGRSDNQQRQGGRGHGDRRGHQGNRRNGGGEQQASSDGNREGRDHREGREARGDNKGPRGNRDGGRPQHQGNRSERNDRQDRGDRKERNDRNDRNNRGASQPLRFEAKPPRKEKPIDPDSPFAKLAALKEQMKK
jgi:ATP-dependent RNA helicase SUPV3L1/SUV3